ncbi:hypothetical protein NHX12_002736, partial [Muraenolepis orangiensis]
MKLKEPYKRHDTCIEFTVAGSPHPTLRWYYKDKEILHDEFVRTEFDIYKDDVEGCLMFKNPTHFNNGNYTLVASNLLGVATKTVYGHFLNKPFFPDTPAPTITVTHRPEEDTFGVSIAVGLAGFACVMLIVLFVLINKYGRRSKFGMKEEQAWSPTGVVTHRRGHPQAWSPTGVVTHRRGHPPAWSPTGVVTHRRGHPPAWSPTGVVTHRLSSECPRAVNVN